VLHDSRRHEELKKRLFDGARTQATYQDVFVSNYLLDQAQAILPALEMLPLLDALKPVFDRQEARLRTGKRWAERRLGLLQSAGRPEEALKLQRQLAAEFPRDHALGYAQALAGVGDYAAAYAWLEKCLGGGLGWTRDEESRLRQQYVEMLYA